MFADSDGNYSYETFNAPQRSNISSVNCYGGVGIYAVEYVIKSQNFNNYIPFISRKDSSEANLQYFNSLKKVFCPLYTSECKLEFEELKNIEMVF